jgi:hypothetical protein
MGGTNQSNFREIRASENHIKVKFPGTDCIIQNLTESMYLTV